MISNGNLKKIDFYACFRGKANNRPVIERLTEESPLKLEGILKFCVIIKTNKKKSM